MLAGELDLVKDQRTQLAIRCAEQAHTIAEQCELIAELARSVVELTTSMASDDETDRMDGVATEDETHPLADAIAVMQTQGVR